MAGSKPGQGRAREEGLGDTIRRRAREAEAAAYEGVKRAIRRGEDLQLKTPGEVLAYGAKRLHAEEARAKQVVSNTIRTAKRRADDALNRLGQDQNLRPIAVGAAQVAGIGVGVGRGVVHAGEGLFDGAKFVSRLIDPLDPLKSPQGQSAIEQLGRGVLTAGQKTVDYVDRGISDPQSVVRDVSGKLQEWRRDLDPSATPAASTFEGELRRNFDIGQNQGELAFDVGSLAFGGPAAKAVKGLEQVSNIGNVERYLAQGFGPKGAARLAEPYPASGMGSHFVPRRTRLPGFLGGGPLPQSFIDGPFNKLVPPGSSIGDLYERHYAVDPRFHGTSAGGERWSGRDLGLKRYGRLGQLWYGSPAPLKARVGGLGAASGSGLHDAEEEIGW